MHRSKQIHLWKILLFLCIALGLLVVGRLYRETERTAFVGSILTTVNGYQALVLHLPHGSGEVLPAGMLGLLTCPTDNPPAGFRWTVPQDLVQAGAQDPLIYEYTDGFITEKNTALQSLARWSGNIFSLRGIANLEVFAAGRTYFINAANDIMLRCSVPAGSSSSSSSSTTVSGDHEYWIPSGGTQRRYLLHVPPSYVPGSPAPLIIAMHGGGGNAENAVETFNLNPVADQHGFLVAYPEGTGSMVVYGKVSGSWNAGGCCGEAALRRTDDVGFIGSMLDHIESNFSINPKRVFATGFSNGSMMSYRLAAEMSDRIAAIAPFSGQPMILSWNMVRPVATLHIHGIDDPCALYNGSNPPQFCGTCLNQYYNVIGIPTIGSGSFSCTAAATAMNSWRSINRLSATTRTTLTQPNVTCYTYDQPAPTAPQAWKDEAAEVELCSISSMGHTFPKTNPVYDIASCHPDCSITSCTAPQQYIYDNYCVPWKDIVGSLSDAIDGPSMLWEFFNRHPML